MSDDARKDRGVTGAAAGADALRRAAAALKRAEEKLAAFERAKTEPIAIIGMGCRFPGDGEGPDGFWRTLKQGTDAVRQVPSERWEVDATHPPECRWGAFLDDVKSFDALFFGISPREAENMDPQHRLLLEVTWEALEDAGLSADELMGSSTGVFVGVAGSDFEGIQFSGDWRSRKGVHAATGVLGGAHAGRISYTLGLQGPCAVIDTACSSSAAALHLACQSIRSGECDTAIVAGIGLLLAPAPTFLLSQMQALSPDGRCKTFDASANGYVRGEGCGVVVLRRLSQARAHGDRIWALVRGSGMNQDGRSAGLTAPNVLAQVAVLRQALSNARVSPSQIGYVEAHGTGTSLGDPIEIEALREVVGARRPDGSPCYVGSLKTNIGHLEGAAGIAGVIKAALVSHHGVIPRHLHFRSLNPRMSLEGTALAIPVQERPWPTTGTSRVVGVSSFGASGTNVHVILEEAPTEEARMPAKDKSAYVLPLSAKSHEALVATARSYADWLVETNDVMSLHDLVYTASVRRTHHEHRLSVAFATREELATQLAAYARGEAPSGVIQGRTSQQGRPKLVFVFSGQGSQWAGMGRKLLEEEPVFRAKLDEIENLLRAHVSFVLQDELAAAEDRSRLGETEIAQPALFALQVALVELLKSWGVAPDAVIGHSVGEIAAAHVSGALSLEEAVRLVVLRGRIMQRATGHGKMAWVALPAAEASRAIAGREGKVSIAAVNDPTSVVLSGETAALDAIVAELGARGVVARPLRVNYAFHSPQMDPFVRELVEGLGRVEAKAGVVSMYSTVTGARIEGTLLDAGYWGRNVRAPVDLAGAVSSALGEGHRWFVEVGPHPVLLGNLQQCIEERRGDAKAIPTLKRQGEERRRALEALGALHAAGFEIDWKNLFPEGGRVVSLPRYPWQRERYWVEPAQRRAGAARREGDHPLLGTRIDPASQPEVHLWEQSISVEAFPYLADHRVQGEVVFPGAGYAEMALSAAADLYGEGASWLEEITIEQVLVIPEGGACLLQISVLEEPGGRATVTLSSRQQDSKVWVRHARGVIGTRATPAPAAEPIAAVERRCVEVVEAAAHYQQMEASGLSYGTSFQGLERLRIGRDEVLAFVRLPDAACADLGSYHVHPALLDACFQAAGWSLRSMMGTGTFVVAKLAGVRVHERPGRAGWIHSRMANAEPGASVLSIVVRDDAGRALVEIGELRVQRLAETEHAGRDALSDCVFDVAWQRKELAGSAASPAGAWLVFADARGLGAAVAERLRARGRTCVEVTAGDGYVRESESRYRIHPTNLESWQRLLADAFGRTAPRGVLYCGALGAAEWAETTEATLAADLRRGALGLTRLAQALLRQGFVDLPRLFVVTRAAQVVGSTTAPPSVPQSALWGLGRTIAMEQPALGCVQMDLPPEVSPDEPDRVLQELLAGGDEDRIALRPEGRYVARLVRGRLDAEPPERQEPAGGRPCRLEIPEPGVLERLCLRPIERRPPGPGEIEIEVEASGLNFIDVMKAMGIYPGMDPSAVHLGGECAGRIVALGEGVEGLHVGQAVLACVAPSFATHVTVRAAFAVPKPAELSFEQAATIPAVFMTVYWALHHAGRLRRGERVLIHSATGGTGLAAIQYARAVGAEIFATAGSEEKRAYLRSLGVEHVMDSRTLAFADEVMARTSGRGVDVVLNSLTGDALVKSIEVLGAYGRFLEIGKKDIYQNTKLGLLPFRKSLSYTAIDIAAMAEEKPAQFAALLRDVMARFEDGTFQPEPVHVFPASAADSAFRLMAQARHIGKIAVTMKDPDARVVLRGEQAGAQIRADGTYLITGGLGGLGLSLSRWLVERGARHLALLGRSAPSEAAQAVIRDMRAAGADVRVLRGDVARRADVDAALSRLESEMPPLRGVVHAAAVLEDRTLPEMTEDQFWKPIGPKVFGGWNLHEATRERSLDFFVTYSSVAGLFGSPGQANYALANACLDALCQARAAMGLSGMSLQWGPFAKVGLAAASDVRGNRGAARGIESFEPEEGNELFHRVLTHPRPVVGLVRLDVGRLREAMPQLGRSPFLEEIGAQATGDQPGGPPRGLLDTLAHVAPDERIVHMEAHVLTRIGQVLRLDPSRIDRLAPFSSLGLDSLMNLELRNRLEPDLGLKLSPALLFAHPTAAALAEHLLQRLALPDGEPSPVEPRHDPAPEAPPAGTEVSELSEDDVEARLQAKLASLSALLD